LEVPTRTREVKDKESGQLVIPDACIEAATEAIKALAQEKMQGKFKPDGRWMSLVSP
jgi:hypothetical protein